MFLPTTKKEMKVLGWNALDVILVTGDSYIDSPFIGVAVIGKVLVQAGFRVGIIAQPDISSGDDITRLGEPELFWGVSGGSIDSMVANRTAIGRKRKKDDYTPGGENNRRPDRAVIKYTNLVKQFFKSRRPIVLGGLEASLRRVAHYDFWTDKIRKSILLDSKADFLLYGMGERSTIELANAIKENTDVTKIRGMCYLQNEKPQDCLELPSFEEVSHDKDSFAKMFHLFYKNNDPKTAKTLAQKHGNRFLIHNPPAFYLSTKELDKVHEIKYERDVHPYYKKDGNVRALDTIRFAIPTHRGCYGECNFCSIAVHQGRTVRWRSRTSILAEARELTKHPLFKGTIHDLGGPTANMYGFECRKKLDSGACEDKRCLYPTVCKSMPIDHQKQLELLRELRAVPGVKKIVVASGIRYDVILADQKNGEKYLRQIVRHHTSGQMKVAPEHSEDSVLKKMGKPGQDKLIKFKNMFDRISKSENMNQFLTYYIIAGHPGCTRRDMEEFKRFASSKLGVLPKQVQVFTPTPSTYSTLMYWTEKDPFTGEKCFVEKTFKGRDGQKDLIVNAADLQTKRRFENKNPKGSFRGNFKTRRKKHGRK